MERISPASINRCNLRIYPRNRVNSKILPDNINNNHPMIFPYEVGSKKDTSFQNMTGIIVAVFIILCAIGYYGYSYESFANSFRQKWERVEVSDGSYYGLELDIDQEGIRYNFDTWLIDTTISSFDYVIVAPGIVKIYNTNRDKIYTVEIDADSMKIEPALTSTDAYECWYR